MITATRYHDFSCGHRVVGHESKCALLHGHNYRIHFTLRGELDKIGRVLDFSAIKIFCNWLEEHWDHRFLAWEYDPILRGLAAASGVVAESLVFVPFNPTAENMADYLLRVVGPDLLGVTDCTLIEVTVEETRKCSAKATLWPT